MGMLWICSSLCATGDRSFWDPLGSRTEQASGTCPAEEWENRSLYLLLLPPVAKESRWSINQPHIFSFVPVLVESGFPQVPHAAEETWDRKPELCGVPEEWASQGLLEQSWFLQQWWSKRWFERMEGQAQQTWDKSPRSSSRKACFAVAQGRPQDAPGVSKAQLPGPRCRTGVRIPLAGALEFCFNVNATGWSTAKFKNHNCTFEFDSSVTCWFKCPDFYTGLMAFLIRPSSY